MNFHYETTNPNDDEKVIIVVEIDNDLRMPKVKVDLGSIAFNKEVVVEFGIENFDNKNTFYTDSNGLEM